METHYTIEADAEKKCVVLTVDIGEDEEVSLLFESSESIMTLCMELASMALHVWDDIGTLGDNSDLTN